MGVRKDWECDVAGCEAKGNARKASGAKWKMIPNGFTLRRKGRSGAPRPGHTMCCNSCFQRNKRALISAASERIRETCASMAAVSSQSMRPSEVDDENFDIHVKL